MKLDYVIFYAEASVICIVILTILLLSDRRYGILQEKQICFRRAVISFILYFISDACWAAVLGGAIPKTRTGVILFNLTNYAIMSLMSYEWFMFMSASENMFFREIPKKKFFARLPMIISILFIVIAFAVNPYYWVSENNELNSMYYPLMLMVPVFYLLIGLVYSIINIHKTKKMEYLPLVIFPVGVMAFGMLQLAGLDAPTFCFGCTIMWLWYYIKNMQMMISTDALTQLNNRGQINRFMEQVKPGALFMMLDIDGFKGINDTYGHSEGDRALVLVADALQASSENIKGSVFLGRYGGDEFTVIIQDLEAEPGQVISVIQDAVRERKNENQIRYALEVTIGYDELKDGNAKECLNRADKMLYREKHKKGTGR